MSDFLKDRNFKVFIDGSYSDSKNIECSVPQGSVLGPILFLIYINDIPLTDSKHLSYSSLFADDLATLFFYTKSLVQTKNRINSYISSLVKWLFKWRLKVNAFKCCYTIFSKGGNCNKSKIEIKLNNGIIPYDPKPLFLGITFDERLNFSEHTENLSLRALKRINIIKILSHKSWHLGKDTLKNVYNALIGSIFAYSFFTVARLSKSNLDKLQRIQNRAIRSIFKLEWNSANHLIPIISGILPVKERLIQLGIKYLPRALLKNSNISLLLREYIDSKSSIQRNNKPTPLCIFYFDNMI